MLDPNLLSLLFLAGIAGIGFEIFHPGVVLPGALGAVSLLLALFGLAVLPTRGPASGSSCSARRCSSIDAHVVSHGALTRLRADRARASASRRSSTTRPAPYHDVDPARGRDHGRDRRRVGARHPQGGRRRDASRCRSARREIVGMQGVVREGGRRLRPRRAVEGPGGRAARDRASAVEVDALDGLTLACTASRIAT